VFFSTDVVGFRESLYRALFGDGGKTHTLEKGQDSEYSIILKSGNNLWRTDDIK
jgi:hypothetical protein